MGTTAKGVAGGLATLDANGKLPAAQSPDSAPLSGDVHLTTGGLFLDTAGKGLHVKEGANACMGTGTLNGATNVVIATNKVTATSRIFLTIQNPGGTPTGQIWIVSRSAGVSFTVKGIASDTSDFAWMIVEPSP